VIGIIATAKKGKARIIRMMDIITNPPILKNWSEKRGSKLSAKIKTILKVRVLQLLTLFHWSNQ